MCLYPKLIRNPKYKANKKNKGNIPEMRDLRVGFVPIGCGNCIECRKQKANEWRVRIAEELRHDWSGVFVTLTMSNKTIKKIVHKISKDCKRFKIPMLEGYELDYEVARRRINKFRYDWRDKIGGSCKRFLVTELGHEGTENLHFHGFIFAPRHLIKKAWGDDFVYLGYSNGEACVNYVTKYIFKVDADHKYFKPQVFVSDGFGRGYMDRLQSKKNAYKPGGTDESYRFKDGTKGGLPIYFRNKIYSEDERELLWLEKLDNQERYVLGVKVDISHDYSKYERLLREARLKNKRLGYGESMVEWESFEQENNRRTLLNLQRCEK